MDEMTLGLIIAYGKPVLFVVALLLGSLAVLLTFASGPKWPALALFLVILNFINPSYGFIEARETNIYAWGMGKLPFPLIHFYLYGLFLATLLRNVFSDIHPLRQAGALWCILFGLMYAGHFVAGLAEVPHWLGLFPTRGIIHILHMGMFMYIVASVLETEEDLRNAIKIFLIFAVARAVYGLARYFLFGGDPQNAYANYQDLNVKITYWDVIEGLIATIAAAWFFWRLVHDWAKLSPRFRFLFIVCLGLEILLILLTYRRTSMLGLLLAFFYLLMLLPLRNKLAFGFVGAALLVPALFGVAAHRTQELMGTSQLGFLEVILPDAAGTTGITDPENRFYELYKAFKSIQDNLIFGLGLWGQFQVGMGDLKALAYHRGAFDFIHSGFGHVLMKSGLLGLFLFLGILYSAWRFAGKGGVRVPADRRAMLVACRAGLWFMLPTLMFGTPIIEMRTMLWLGLILAVPIAIVRMSQGKTEESAAPVGHALQAQRA